MPFSFNLCRIPSILTSNDLAGSLLIWANFLASALLAALAAVMALEQSMNIIVCCWVSKLLKALSNASSSPMKALPCECVLQLPLTR